MRFGRVHAGQGGGAKESLPGLCWESDQRGRYKVKAQHQLKVTQAFLFCFSFRSLPHSLLPRLQCLGQRWSVGGAAQRRNRPAAETDGFDAFSKTVRVCVWEIKGADWLIM